MERKCMKTIIDKIKKKHLLVWLYVIGLTGFGESAIVFKKTAECVYKRMVWL